MIFTTCVFRFLCSICFKNNEPFYTEILKTTLKSRPSMNRCMNDLSIHIGQLNLGMKGDDKSQRAASTSKMSIKAHQSSRNSTAGRISVFLMHVKRGGCLVIAV